MLVVLDYIDRTGPQHRGVSRMGHTDLTVAQLREIAMQGKLHMVQLSRERASTPRKSWPEPLICEDGKAVPNPNYPIVIREVQ